MQIPFDDAEIYLSTCHEKPIFGVKFFVMQSINVGKLKANFSDVLKKVESGEEFAILFGKRKKIVAKLVPPTSDKSRRKLGMWNRKAKVKFHKDFKMTGEEFIGL
ncbi:MAG: hypothetical protein ABI267_01800 [Ginsengibacter sp.]